MNISKVNNVSFGRIYYTGLCTKTPNNYYSFNCTPSSYRENVKSYLTESQKKVTYLIEKSLFPTTVEKKLDLDLSRKDTDIVFYYKADGNIELHLSKYGKDIFGEEYSFIPYNKKGTKRIEETFSVKDITLKEIKEKTKNFIKDCKAYLKDKNNKRNIVIENDLYDQW